ncbi:Rieske (2Fe-2S) protein [Mesorhizobium sp. BR1-1-16]|uniref:Rieske (2Fe-2S) protein n=1 Tax=Mesorhizobium sp. BR1-1-16 TaxID=2876653 RepID=UPI001CCCFA3F|nr:Rieske (2Fe-2S) protein [Mesorhizobium sp. BR1-1-16]MBZ9936897.1 Rieske (2Fe-2S) protein [Mesorhizobium sp. BR1-1-16]HWJ73922.1 Rieske (2Fe-2S) protein [Kaistia sp.]
MAYHVVAAIEDMPPGSRRVIEVNGRAVAVFNVEGEFYALLNRCPHQGADLCNGLLTVAVTSTEPGIYDFDPSRNVIRCPWHAWEFDVRTGKSWCEPNRVKVRSFKTEVRSGKLIEGPYVAETFPVKTDGTYVLVEA